jgi:hypothetical protein
MGSDQVFERSPSPLVDEQESRDEKLMADLNDISQLAENKLYGNTISPEIHLHVYICR